MILGKSDFWPHRGLRFRILRKITYEGDFSALIHQQNQGKHRYRGYIRESTLSHGLVETFESTKKIKMGKKIRANFFFWVCQNRQFYPFLVVIYYLWTPQLAEFFWKNVWGVLNQCVFNILWHISHMTLYDEVMNCFTSENGFLCLEPLTIGVIFGRKSDQIWNRPYMSSNTGKKYVKSMRPVSR